VSTGDDHTGVPSNRGIPEGAGQPIGTVPVDPEPSHASRVGRNSVPLVLGARTTAGVADSTVQGWTGTKKRPWTFPPK